ncbi:hypothetical protein GPECTOR_28g856 [Gonium pectorale]|uniref:Protein kinase domain-containing protein n=1 Tax=Gonium pectorale TaxID=33097 RepID=A0A150GF49_GONPE|nr:hypothetical protein GPECTOR_28g856 [Gonium pectorale]|eukprot:KXZ48446.1 hypothetical protein GPECTOR_28g856 [Gonium pectorale]
MPDFTHEVFTWRVRVANLAAPRLSAVNVTLRCGIDATNSTTPVGLLAAMDPQTPGLSPVSIELPCIASIIDAGESVGRAMARANSALKLRANYLMFAKNTTVDNAYMMNSIALYNLTVFAGRPGVPTQVDLIGLVATLSVAADVEGNRLVLQDLVVAGLGLGPSSQYPAALIRAAVWILDFKRQPLAGLDGYLVMLAQRVRFVVPATEMAWWRGRVRAALAAGSPGVDTLIRAYDPRLTVLEGDGADVLVPFWEWNYGLMQWENCSITRTPLVPLATKIAAAPTTLLDTLLPYGHPGPMPLSSVRVQSLLLDVDSLTKAPAGAESGFAIVLRGDVSMQTDGDGSGDTAIQVEGGVRAVVASAQGAGRRRHLAQQQGSVSGSADQGPDLPSPVSPSGSPSPPNPGPADGADAGGGIPLGPYQPWLQLMEVTLVLPAVELQLIQDLVSGNRTSLRVAPEVLSFYRGVLAGARGATATSNSVKFAWISYMGIEGSMITLSSTAPTAFTSLPVNASFLIPANVTPPTASQSPVIPVVLQPAPAPALGTVLGAALGGSLGVVLLGVAAAAMFFHVQRRRDRDGDRKVKGSRKEPVAAAEDPSRAPSQGRNTGGSSSPRHLLADHTHNSGDVPAPEAIAGASASGGAASGSAGDAPASGSGRDGESAASGTSGRKTSRSSGTAGAENGRPPQPRRHKSGVRTGSTASGATRSSAAPGSGSGSPGTSDGASNPRTELYAALAAFQSELGEQQHITITSQLGAGAHGIVYKGEWRGLEVAVKTLLFQAFVGSGGEESGNSFKEQAMLEAAIATTLFHPNVINTFAYDIKPLRMCPAPAPSNSPRRAGGGAGADGMLAGGGDAVLSSEGGGIMDWKLYIIQEYCDGGTLKDALDGSRWSDPETGMGQPEVAVRVALEIAAGMTYIHARNIIHGDLKPANILLRSNTASAYGYTAKIADFGLALKLKAGESHISNIRRGTPFYIAAELVEDGRATTASDLYSFGVILWELLHGSTVARRLPLRRRIPNLPAEFYTWPPTAPAAYRELASACLSPSPSARPRFADVFNALSKLLTEMLDEKKRLQREEAERRQLEESQEALRSGRSRERVSLLGEIQPAADEEGGAALASAASSGLESGAVRSGRAGSSASNAMSGVWPSQGQSQQRGTPSRGLRGKESTGEDGGGAGTEVVAKAAAASAAASAAAGATATGTSAGGNAPAAAGAVAPAGARGGGALVAEGSDSARGSGDAGDGGMLDSCCVASSTLDPPSGLGLELDIDRGTTLDQDLMPAASTSQVHTVSAIGLDLTAALESALGAQGASHQRSNPQFANPAHAVLHQHHQELIQQQRIARENAAAARRAYAMRAVLPAAHANGLGQRGDGQRGDGGGIVRLPVNGHGTDGSGAGHGGLDYDGDALLLEGSSYDIGSSIV